MDAASWRLMRSLPSSIWWVAGATLVNRTGAMVLPFLLLYLTRGRGLDVELAGQIAACWGIGSFLAGPLGGWASDRIDGILLLAFSLLAGGALLVGYPAVTSPLGLAAMTLGVALFVDLSRPSTMTVLARLGGERSRDAFALNYLAINLGMSIGPTLGGYVAEHDYRWLFWIDGCSSLLAGSCLVLANVRCPAQPRRPSGADWNLGLPGFSMIAWQGLILYVFLTFFNASPIFAVRELGLSEHDCGLIWLINTVLIVLTTLWINRLTQGYRLTALLAGAAAGIAACYAVLTVSPNLTGLLVGILFLTFAEIVLFANANSYLSQVVRPEQIGKAMGMNAMATSLALTLSGPTVGYFFKQRGSRELWAFLCLLGLIAAWGFARLPQPGTRSADPEDSSHET